MNLDETINFLPKKRIEKIGDKDIEMSLFIRYRRDGNWCIGYGRRKVMHQGATGKTITEAVINFIKKIKEENEKQKLL